MNDLSPTAVGRTCYTRLRYGSPPGPEEFDTPLTREELAKRRRALAMLSVHSVRDAYRKAYERCKMNGDNLPRAAAIQELVTAWK